MRSFTANGAKVPFCEPRAQGDQAPRPNPSLLIPGPKFFPFIQSPSPERKKLPSGNIFLFFSVNLSPFHYFFYTHARTRICLGLARIWTCSEVNLPLAGFNPIHVNLNGLLMIVIMVFKVGAEIQRYLKQLTPALTL